MADEELIDNEPEATESLDDVIGSAYDEIMARDDGEETSKAVKLSDQPRDSTGKFAREGGKPLPDAPVAEATQAPVETIEKPAKVEAPNSWKAIAKEKFATLDPELQQEISRREQDVQRAFSAHDQDRTFGKSLREVVSPYAPMITAEGATPESAIKSLLNTAYLLRNGSAQEKGMLIADLARRYGADISASEADQGEPVHPVISELQAKIALLESSLHNRARQEQEQETQQLTQSVQSFLADPKYPYANDVAPQIAQLMRAGIAKDLPDAYNQAIYLNPDVRQRVITATQTESQRKQIEEAKARAEAAKRSASTNLRSRPSLPPRAMNGSIEQTLSETYDHLMGSA
jgi:hypothetical protein